MANFFDHLNVVTKNYSSNYKFFDKNLVYFKRNHFYKKQSLELDVFPNSWSLAISNLKKDQLKIRAGEKLVSIDGLWAAFIPPFSIIEWQVEAGDFNFEAYLCTDPLPLEFSREAFVFPLAAGPLPQSMNEIFGLIDTASKTQVIGRCLKPTSVAARTKDYIDKNFSKKTKLSDVAKELNYSHSVMTRFFKKCYGLSPIAYRNKLRIYDSIQMMLIKGLKVSEAGLDSGFSDMSRFHSTFQRYIHARPSQFKRKLP